MLGEGQRVFVNEHAAHRINEVSTIPSTTIRVTAQHVLRLLNPAAVGGSASFSSLW
eukprot:m.571262 g.571262  ORF g.571262 m.571262 type:complete len:56 (-) comp57856_c0_seq4:1287-1454(-)